MVERPDQRGLTVKAWFTSVTERKRERGGGNGVGGCHSVTEREREGENGGLELGCWRLPQKERGGGNGKWPNGKCEIYYLYLGFERAF